MELKPGYRQTEVGVIPKDWRYDRVGEYLTLQRGVDIVQADVRGGAYPVVSSSGVSYYHSKWIAKPPGVVTGRKGKIGETYFLEVPFWPHDTSLWVKDFKGNVPRYVYYFLKSLRLERLDAASAVPTLNRNNVHALTAAFPPTKAEQEAIADALSDADALIESLEQLIAKKRQVKQGAMQELLAGKRRLPGFSGEWDVAVFGDIATIRNMKVLSSAVPPGTQCVELESIGQDSGRLLMSTDATGLSSKYSFKKGDVLFGRLRAYLRKYWLATFDGVCSTEIWPLIPRDERLYGGFLHFLVQTNDFVNAAGVSYGTHMPRSDWSVLKKFPVQLPPGPEQTAIAAVLSDMDAELSALEARRDKTRDLKQGMMHELLKGRIRLV